MAFDAHAPNDFPAFSDGDVTIKLAADKLYQLHAHTLRDLSPTLREMLTPGGRCQTGVARAQDFIDPKTGRIIKGGKMVKFRLELDTEHWCLRPQVSHNQVTLPGACFACLLFITTGSPRLFQV